MPGNAIIRLIFFLLVFINLLFFAWTQDYFGATDDGREPQRLGQQLNAEQLRVLRESPAPTAKKEALVCRVISNLSIADAETLKSAVGTAGGEAKVFPLAEPTLHLVVITDLANKATADRKAAELIRFGVKDQNMVALEGGRHEIILGRFDTETAATAFLQGLTKRGIKSARVDSREQSALKARVEARAPASMLLLQLPQLIAPHADALVGECAV